MITQTYRFPKERFALLEERIKEIAQEQGSIHHSQLKSIAESYRFDYATGRNLAKKYKLKVR